MSTVSSNRQAERVVHVAGPRPTPNQLAHEIRDVAVSIPLFATAPLLRRWHRRWGATDAELTAAMRGDAQITSSITVLGLMIALIGTVILALLIMLARLRRAVNFRRGEATSICIGHTLIAKR
jgi:hypothetical protein